MKIYCYNSSAVRTITDKGGKLWFVLTDIGKILQFANVYMRISKFDDDMKSTHIIKSSGGNQVMTLISKYGVLRLLATTAKPKAKPFQKWLTSELLPAIHRGTQC